MNFGSCGFKSRSWYNIITYLLYILHNGLNPDKIPQHIAIIMDGNGRWAQKKGLNRTVGHQKAVKSIKSALHGCIELSIPYLTLFAFSQENWQRPQQEINFLMDLFVSIIQQEHKNIIQQDIKVNIIGEIKKLPLNCQEALHYIVEASKNNSKICLTFAISYSGRWDILEAIKQIVLDIGQKKLDSKSLCENKFASYLQSANLPDPDLIIRTSGETRVSNFLLWQMAYSEIYFCNIFWPMFRKKHLLQAIGFYQKKERRFGKV